MGVPKFYGVWILRKSKRLFRLVVISEQVPSDVASILLDANSLVYKPIGSVYGQVDADRYNKMTSDQQIKIKNRKKVVSRMTREQLEAEHFAAVGMGLSNILTYLSVSMGEYDNSNCLVSNNDLVDMRGRSLQNFVIAIDGVAPQAKISQQRSRRYRGAQEASQDEAFTNASITPGTEFMKRLDNYLKRVWIPNNRETLGKRVIYSSHLSPNEAEHKIMDYLRDGKILGTNNDTDVGSHIIYGMDTDLIMLSLLSPIKRLYLWREDIGVVLNIDNLREEIINIMGVHSHSYRDFVFLMFFLGNDFLPNQVGVDDYENSIDKMIEQYKKVGRPITDENGIIWESFLLVLEKLVEIEPSLIEHESYRQFTYRSKVFEYSHVITQEIGSIQQGQIRMNIQRSRKFDIDRFRSAWYSYALAPRSNMNTISSLLGYDPYQVKNEDIVKMSSHYLTGLSWIYNYYTKGPRYINQRWYYPYLHSPNFRDIYATLKMLLSEGKNITGWEHTGEETLSVVHQLLSVIPPQLYQLLPVESQHLLKDTSPISDYFPTNFQIDRGGFNEKWRGIALLPFVDPYRIINAVNKYTFFEPHTAEELASVNDVVEDLEDSKIQSICIKSTYKDLLEIKQLTERSKRPAYQGYRGRGRGDRGRGGGYRGRGGYQESRGGGGGRGGYQESRGGGGGRGGYQERGRGGYQESRGGGRGGYQESRGGGRGGLRVKLPGRSTMLPPPPGYIQK